MAKKVQVKVQKIQKGKPLPISEEEMEAPEDAPPVPPSPEPSSPFLAETAAQNELADLKSRLAALEDAQAVRKQQVEDFRVALVCVISTVKRVEEKFGIRFMPKGEFYGIKFE